ncbi:unnamed protein product, partial [Medioppia subpectinata]
MGWCDLSYGQKSWHFSGKRVPKTILHALNGRIDVHTLTALMGPSGAGKSTLLKCVNMRSNAGLSPQTQLFGSKTTQLRTAFIMQSLDEHILIGLTIRESLLFASKIKNRVTSGHIYDVSGGHNIAQSGQFESDKTTLTSGTSGFVSDGPESEPLDIDGHFDHNMNVRRLLSELLLEDCADTTVQRCSGGEQKRLTVGLELVQQIKPNLLCIDEPTSGLDSNSSEIVIQCLKRLTEKHSMAIVTSIHQPNSLILSMFDRLYVLSKGGHCVFAGPPAQLRAHLNSCGVDCPPDFAPIELMLKIASKFPNKALLTVGHGYIERSVEVRHQWMANLALCTFCMIASVALSYLYDFHVGERTPCIDRWIPTVGRNTTQAQPSVAGRALLLAAKGAAVAENVKLLFFANFAVGAMPLAKNLFIFPVEVRVFLNEHRNGWYSTGAYYWSKFIIEIPILVGTALLFSTMLFFISHQPSDAFRW